MEKTFIMLETAKTIIATGAEQSPDRACVMAMIDMEPLRVAATFSCPTNGASPTLVGEHGMVLLSSDSVGCAKPCIEDGFGIVSCPLATKGAMSLGVSVARFGYGKLAAYLAVRMPSPFACVRLRVELADRLQLATSCAALLCVRAWMWLVALAHVDLVALLAERHKTISARWMSVKPGSWLKGATDPACFFHAVL